MSHSGIPDYSTLPLFDGVPSGQLCLVTPEMVRFYADQEPLFHQGDEADGLVILLHGQVKIVADDEFLLARAPYSVVGEQAFINGTPRSATAIAEGMIRALVLPRPVTEGLMTDATFCRNLLRLVSQKLAEATNERAFRFRNERLLFSEFRAHVSPEVAYRLLAGGLNYGDPRYIDAVILFSDIRSFTPRSAGMTPDEIAAQLSPYLDAVVDVVHRHNGLVDKFIGDAVMAIWGFVPSEADLAAQAFACAQEMVTAAVRMRFGGEPIAIGVGLNAGQEFIGNVGGEGKRQFTILGTPVNLAARYESEAKALGSPIVLGQALYDRLSPDLQKLLVSHENRAVKGAAPQTLFTYRSDGTGEHGGEA